MLRLIGAFGLSGPSGSSSLYIFAGVAKGACTEEGVDDCVTSFRGPVEAARGSRGVVLGSLPVVVSFLAGVEGVVERAGVMNIDLVPSTNRPPEKLALGSELAPRGEVSEPVREGIGFDGVEGPAPGDCGGREGVGGAFPGRAGAAERGRARLGITEDGIRDSPE